jgi:SAM-dependent methyltransferase
VTVDHYARSGQRWAAGAALVYAPIATQLVALSPHSLEGRSVIDVGAGTGVASAALAARGARPIAADFSYDMLAWNAAARPPAVVSDACWLPLVASSVDDGAAAFVLNHLPHPAAGFAELSRVIRPGGALLACVYSNASRSAVRDRVDAVAQQAGWEVPGWYIEMKASVTPLLGSAANMATVARAAGLVDVWVDEQPVDVGVIEPEQLVVYRFGQAQFATWLDAIGEDRAEEIRRRAVDAIRPTMRPYEPIVVFLSARVPAASGRQHFATRLSHRHSNPLTT